MLKLAGVEPATENTVPLLDLSTIDCIRPLEYENLVGSAESSQKRRPLVDETIPSETETVVALIDDDCTEPPLDMAVILTE